MEMPMKRVLFTFFLIIPSLLWSQVSLNDLMLETGTRLIWDSTLQRGTLYKGDNRVVFSEGIPLLNVNFEITLKIDPPLNDNGLLLFSDEAARIIYDYFASKRTDKDFKVTVILLDPGHGGKDWGAYRRTMVDSQELYIKEKNVNLDMALRLQALLKEKYPHKIIALTREDDTFITLEERVAIAESYQFSPREGMVFLSIHSNASLNKEARGFEIWYLPDDVERELAQGEEADEVTQVLNTLWQGVFTQECYSFARFLLDRIDQRFPDSFPNRGLKRELWYVLRNKNMVSALAELAFVSHKDDVALLQDELFLENYSEALVQGIGDFITYFED
jgi:N-acetylmuramoyl-L-alanine amidase